MLNDLTICIPTYNRWDTLLKTLPYLLSKAISGITIRVVDNCSTDDGKESVQKVIDSYPNLDCKIISNKANLGAEGNFLRCIEICTTKYIYILGDDDLVSDEFFDLAQKYLVSEYSYGWIFFSHQHKFSKKIKNDLVYSSPWMLTEGNANWAELMFISSSIFSTEILRKGMLDAQLYQSTLSVLLIAVLKGYDRLSSEISRDYLFLYASKSLTKQTGMAETPGYTNTFVYPKLGSLKNCFDYPAYKSRIVRNALRNGIKTVFKPRVYIKHLIHESRQKGFRWAWANLMISSQDFGYFFGLRAVIYKISFILQILVASIFNVLAIYLRRS